MDYFDLASINQYSEAIGDEYDSASAATRWYFDTREKLKHLVNLLAKELNESFHINYTEKPNKQAGQGMGFVLKDYVLIGFIPERYMRVGKEIFIKPSLSHFKDDKAVFSLDLDVNFKNSANPYIADRQQLQDQTSWKVPVDESFPKNWDDLIKLIKPEITEIITILDDYLLEKKSKNLAEDSAEYNALHKLNVAHPLNQIMFGPPGTGKTYNSINKALQIINEKEEQELDWTNRRKVKELFDKRIETNQIVFTTFHQSMSYEDFIEGIKPIKPVNATDLHYGIVDGIFKNICNEAKRVTAFSVTIDNVTKPLTKELFEEFYYSFSEVLPIHSTPKSNLELKTKENAPFELFKNTVGSIVVKAGIKRTPSTISLNELTSVLFENKVPTYKSYEQIIINKILEDKDFKRSEIDNTQKKFVLIIDEINRGNISQIFGELITLIEEDKRMGRKEAVKVTLPYSKEIFEVPQNVYIIGTMNTADRSVEALDAALRRRFSFFEMPSEPKLISSYFVNLYIERFLEMYDVPWTDQLWLKFEDAYKDLMIDSVKYDEIPEDELKNIIYFENKDVQEQLNVFFREKDIQFLPVMVLEKINKRIEKLLDKDHQIGHSYFMQITNLSDFKNVFQTKVIPLLQEYFFGDYGKIGLVLGEGFFEQPSESTADTGLFASFHDYSAEEFEERIIYKTKNITLLSDEEFKIAINKLLKK